MAEEGTRRRSASDDEGAAPAPAPKKSRNKRELLGLPNERPADGTVRVVVPIYDRFSRRAKPGGMVPIYGRNFYVQENGDAVGDISQESADAWMSCRPPRCVKIEDHTPESPATDEERKQYTDAHRGLVRA